MMAPMLEMDCASHEPFLKIIIAAFSANCCKNDDDSNAMIVPVCTAASVCADPNTFQKDATSPMKHCNGDENSDEATCKAAGEAAWRESEDEKCDIGRIEGLTEEEKSAKCVQVGGKWERMPCPLFGFLMPLASLGCDSTPPEEMAQLSNAAGYCCMNEDRSYAAPAALCGVSPPAPAPEPKSCFDLSAEKVKMVREKGFKPRGCDGNLLED